MRRLAALLALSPWCGASGAGAASAPTAAPPTLAATPLAAGETIRLDGRFDEPVWARAAVVSAFRQFEPNEAAEPSEATEVRVAFDRAQLYVAATLRESDPRGIRDNKRHRDADFVTDDVFVVLVDPFGDGHGGYVFATNPAGALRDALIRGAEPNWSWNGLWDVRVARTAGGWQVEMAIPFHALNFDPARGDWTINFRRVIRRRNEEVLWSGYHRAEGFWRSQYGGKLTGLAGLSQGLGLQVQPYATLRRRGFAGADAKFDADAGLDVTYLVSPNLRAALTVNTDFADTEVDELRVNLGRYPLFFPEKRGFFLEGSSVFGFPGRDALTPFYSRRIGLRGEGPVPITWGVRLAGQAGDVDLGVLQIATKAAHGRDAETFSVARAKFRFNADENVGFLFTRRAGEDDDAGATVAFDGTRRLWDHGEGRKAALTAFGIWTEPAAAAVERGGLDSSYLGLEFNGDGRDWHWFTALNQVGASYRPALGFAFDTGYRSIFTYSNRKLRREGGRLRELLLELEFEHRADWDGDFRDGYLWVTPLHFEFRSGDYLGVGGAYVDEAVADAFEIVPGVFVPADRYAGALVKTWMGTAEGRPVSGKAEFSRKDFYGGRRLAAEFTASTRPLPGLELAASAEFNRVRLPGGSFSTRLWRGRASWSFTTRHAVHVLVQTDTMSDTLGLQARFRWNVRPGADVFLGYLRDWREVDDSGRRRWEGSGEESAVKAGYTWVF